MGSIAEQQGTLDYEAAGDTGGGGSETVPQERRQGRGLRVFVHTTLADLFSTDDLTLADTDRLGPILIEQLTDWLQRHGSIASITPVIDLNRTGSVDRHDPPAWMVELVKERDQHCVFPHCTRSSADADLDHITAYDETGPPGQTRPENLAPLCRRHHLAKTFAGWRYRRNQDGTYTWTNKHGHTWLVTALGTIQLD
ncbi:HNH endonuclease signature motif containing protein [Nocardioides dubius]